MNSPTKETRTAKDFNQDYIFRGAGLDKMELNEEGNLNIRANIKANHGIVYKEDNFRDNGPDYIEKYASKQKFSRDQYNSLFGKNQSSIKMRAMSKMEELSQGPNKLSLALDGNNTSQEYFMPPTILTKSGNFDSTLLNTTMINMAASTFS